MTTAARLGTIGTNGVAQGCVSGRFWGFGVIGIKRAEMCGPPAGGWRTGHALLTVRIPVVRATAGGCHYSLRVA